MYFVLCILYFVYRILYFVFFQLDERQSVCWRQAGWWRASWKRTTGGSWSSWTQQLKTTPNNRNSEKYSRPVWTNTVGHIRQILHEEWQSLCWRRGWWKDKRRRCWTQQRTTPNNRITSRTLLCFLAALAALYLPLVVVPTTLEFGHKEWLLRLETLQTGQKDQKITDHKTKGQKDKKIKKRA